MLVFHLIKHFLTRTGTPPTYSGSTSGSVGGSTGTQDVKRRSIEVPTTPIRGMSSVIAVVFGQVW